MYSMFTDGVRTYVCTYVYVLHVQAFWHTVLLYTLEHLCTYVRRIPITIRQIIKHISIAYNVVYWTMCIRISSINCL